MIMKLMPCMVIRLIISYALLDRGKRSEAVFYVAPPMTALFVRSNRNPVVSSGAVIPPRASATVRQRSPLDLFPLELRASSAEENSEHDGPLRWTLDTDAAHVIHSRPEMHARFYDRDILVGELKKANVCTVRQLWDKCEQDSKFVYGFCGNTGLLVDVFQSFLDEIGDEIVRIVTVTNFASRHALLYGRWISKFQLDATETQKYEWTPLNVNRPSEDTLRAADLLLNDLFVDKSAVIHSLLKRYYAPNKVGGFRRQPLAVVCPPRFGKSTLLEFLDVVFSPLPMIQGKDRTVLKTKIAALENGKELLEMGTHPVRLPCTISNVCLSLFNSFMFCCDGPPGRRCIPPGSMPELSRRCLY